MVKQTRFSAVGVMAGSSMDGLDIVQVILEKENKKWTYDVLKAATEAYNSNIYEQLRKSDGMNLTDQKRLDVHFGNWIGDQINDFLKSHEQKIDFVAVHGHTVIHRPQDGVSWQLGAGEQIMQKTKITTITDFRSKDISLGGQGAPLVPIGDFFLFGEFDACLNLGGIANISLRQEQKAWDISPCNQVLNYYANKLGKNFDEGGQLSKQGEIDKVFVDAVKRNDFFGKEPPKSLPNQFLDSQLLDSTSPKNGLRSMTEFIAQQIAYDLSKITISNPKMLVTGGGAHNSFLLERIKEHLPKWDITIPDKKLTDYKEAIIFTFLGALRIRNEVNVLASVTGATKDSSSGVIHFAK